MAGSIFFGFCLVLSAFIFVSVRLYIARPDFVMKILKYGMLCGLATIFSVASLIIGYRIQDRHSGTLTRSLKSVQQIWGGDALQRAPEFYTQTIETEQTETENGKVQAKKKVRTDYAGFDTQKIRVNIRSSIRQKGLLKFAGYTFDLAADYKVTNTGTKADQFYFVLPLPDHVGNLTGVQVLSNGRPFTQDTNLADGVHWSGRLAPGEGRTFEIKYQAQGTGQFTYGLSSRPTQIAAFDAEILSDFGDIEIPEKAMVPAEAATDAGKSRHVWKGNQLIAAQDIALKFEIPGNFGALAAKMLMYSPVGLWLFLALFLMLTISRGQSLHLMHYLMIMAGFFTMPLLASYLFDLMPMVAGLLLALLLSTGIMLYYAVLLKKGPELVRSLAFAAGAFQWIFSLAFFLPEYTGFIVTLAGIVSLVLLMRVTAETDWEGKW